MAVELRIAAFGAALLFIYVFTATRFKTQQYGREWNVGARDEALPPPNPISGRTMRAQANFLETFPIAVVALLGVVIAGKTSNLTTIGGWICAAGVPIVRTIVWTISMVGIAMVLWPLLAG
jgi:uncharacterized MAPEG superfamily protein